MIQNDLKSFQNPKIVSELSICFVKHFYFIHSFIFFISFIYCLFIVCLELCRGHGFIVWFLYVLRSSMGKLVK